MDQLSDINPVERFLVDKANKKQIPISVSFELTPFCNLHCDMCYVRMSKKQIEKNGGLLTLEEWIHIAEEFKQMGTLFILLTGGEPLLYPHFKDLYLRLRQMGFIVSINTNATLLTDETIQLLCEYKPRRVNVTLYGGSNNTYEQLCHEKNGYDRCIEGLKKLKNKDIDVRINLSILKKNQKDYPTLMNVANELGFLTFANCYMSVHCRKVCTSQLDIQSLRMSPDDMAVIEVDHMKRVKGRNFYELLRQTEHEISKGESLLPNGVGLTCRAGTSSCWINWQGLMTPCVDMEEPGVSLRNHKVEEAWKYIVSQCNKLPYYTECKDCKLKIICHVCYANIANEIKHCGTVDYMCQVSKAKYKLIQKLLKELG